MKRVTLFAIIILFTLGCKEHKKKSKLEANTQIFANENVEYITLKGDYMYDEAQNAAIIQTPNNEIYGVIINDMVAQLNTKVKSLKTEKYTSIPVTLRVKKIKNTNTKSAWTHNIEVKEIIKVEAPKKEQDIIKIGQ